MILQNYRSNDLAKVELFLHIQYILYTLFRCLRCLGQATLFIIQVPTPQMKTTNFISPRFIILLTRLDIMDLFTIFELWSHDLCVTWQDTVTLNVFWTEAFLLLRFWILFWHDVTCWKQSRWLSGLSSFTSNLHFYDLWKPNSFYMWVVHESNDNRNPGLFRVHSLVGQRVQTSLHVGGGGGYFYCHLQDEIIDFNFICLAIDERFFIRLFGVSKYHRHGSYFLLYKVSLRNVMQ